MSEYWKSTPKYWCKHCSTFVKDTPFERKQHEGTAKHQNNLKRFLRDIQNSHERGEREKERAKSEVERLKGVAGGDTNRSSSPSPSSRTQTAHSALKPSSGPQSTADRKRQWAQLAEMGIKVPEDFRSEMAMAGDWQVVSQQTIDETPSEAPLSKGVKKRKYEGQDEEEEEKKEAGEAVVRRGWGAATKRYPGHDKADLDDLLSSSISVKKENSGSSGAQFEKQEKDSLQQGNNLVLNQDGRQGGDCTSVKVESAPGNRSHEDDPVLKEEPGSSQPPMSMDQIPEDIPIPVFKKRKAKIS
ncbi:uncharacterized protein Z520_11333 [Fonsecaea multimorphosa CBS 102226]|uniref:U1-type domain-containing protein n=1 Tax=Fonsecaea multimorphosa CBS 102226 TaxID=1442371 RepID=A0A0D2GU75_9EURO|nr:uncharacterized protein Z520_11333 [Fonsecaea multimorphosa CBS 102226]KIX93060.1 hypothetical protein Z520_11333 [Fonsecaea multimorphosa CBS 102226]OAL18306.1 hypothetical protein AYO22_10884 [Fonsecaea multimorphosa]